MRPYFDLRKVTKSGENVIREGTVMSALLTGLCMKFTDKAADWMIPESVKKYL